MKGLSDEDVLLAFAAEERHDGKTLARYLAERPHLRDELLDLLYELDLDREFGPGEDETLGEGVLEKARRRLLDAVSASATAAADGEKTFATALRSRGLASVQAVARLPMELLVAFRDRQLVSATIPVGVLRRLARAVSVEVQEVLAYLELDSTLSVRAAHSSQGKPSAQAKMSFDAFLEDLDLTPEERADILSDAD